MLGSRTFERETSCIKNQIDQWLFAIGVEPIWKEREGPQQIRDPSNFEEILDYPWPWLRTFMFQHVALVTSH